MVKNKEITEKEAKEIGLRLKEIREATGLQQNDFAKSFSTDPTVYNRYESGKIKNMPNSVMWSICEKYNIEVGWLLGFDAYEKYRKPDISPKDYKPIEILGTIAAGIPIEAQEDKQGYEYVPKDFHADFCLRVKGDSMIGALSRQKVLTGPFLSFDLLYPVDGMLSIGFYKYFYIFFKIFSP